MKRFIIIFMYLFLMNIYGSKIYNWIKVMGVILFLFQIQLFINTNNYDMVMI
jgi:hypothetical protein